MVAGLFAQHDVWTGECRNPSRWNRKGYYEGVWLKGLLLEHAGRLVNNCEIAEPNPDFRRDAVQTIREAGYEGGPWLAKHSTLYWRLWSDFEPVWISVRRALHEIRDSCEASGHISNLDSIPLHIKQARKLRQKVQVHEVWSQRLVEGDYGPILPAFAEAGVEFQPEVAEDWIEEELWGARGT